jgi:hypothetical protein
MILSTVFLFYINAYPHSFYNSPVLCFVSKSSCFSSFPIWLSHSLLDLKESWVHWSLDFAGHYLQSVKSFLPSLVIEHPFTLPGMGSSKSQQTQHKMEKREKALDFPRTDPSDHPTKSLSRQTCGNTESISPYVSINTA